MKIIELYKAFLPNAKQKLTSYQMQYLIYSLLSNSDEAHSTKISGCLHGNAIISLYDFKRIALEQLNKCIANIVKNGNDYDCNIVFEDYTATLQFSAHTFDNIATVVELDGDLTSSIAQISIGLFDVKATRQDFSVYFSYTDKITTCEFLSILSECKQNNNELGVYLNVTAGNNSAEVMVHFISDSLIFKLCGTGRPKQLCDAFGKMPFETLQVLGLTSAAMQTVLRLLCKQYY